MRNPVEIIADLVATGMTAEQIALVAELTASASVGAKSARQERNARYYQAKKESLKASETRLNSDAGQDDENRLKASETVLIKTPPRARVRDNNPTKVISGLSLSLERVRECAGDALASMATHPGIASLHPLNALLVGERPCDPEDVYAAVTSAAAWHRSRAGPGKMTSWTTAVRIAAENRDRRIAGAPASERPNHIPTSAADRRRADTDARRGSWAIASAQRAGVVFDEDERGREGSPDHDGNSYLRLAHASTG